MKFRDAISFFEFDIDRFLATTHQSTSTTDYPTFVYVISCEGFVKVGVAKDISRRIADLQVSCPFEMKAAAYRTLPGVRYALLCERATHKMLRRFHHRGEWFTSDVKTTRMALDTAYRATLLLRKRHAVIFRRIEMERAVANDNAKPASQAA